MLAIAPRFSGKNAERQAEIVEEVSPVLQSTLDQYAINTRLRIAHFLGQLCHESAGFRTTEEFASGRAYEGRRDLGNVKKGDGVRYKGRGLIQLTGRSNYRRIGEILNVDLEEAPVLAAEPRISLLIACEYWKGRNINPDCDRDDIIAVTKKINGGTNGLADRRHYTSKAKTALARIESFIVLGASSGERPILHRGSTGEDVGTLQLQLTSAGFRLAIDGDFGPATELAVMQFQTQQSLSPTGIVDEATWDALESLLQEAA